MKDIKAILYLLGECELVHKFQSLEISDYYEAYKNTIETFMGKAMYFMEVKYAFEYRLTTNEIRFDFEHRAESISMIDERFEGNTKLLKSYNIIIAIEDDELVLIGSPKNILRYFMETFKRCNLEYFNMFNETIKYDFEK